MRGSTQGWGSGSSLEGEGKGCPTMHGGGECSLLETPSGSNLKGEERKEKEGEKGRDKKRERGERAGGGEMVGLFYPKFPGIGLVAMTCRAEEPHRCRAEERRLWETERLLD